MANPTKPFLQKVRQTGSRKRGKERSGRRENSRAHKIWQSLKCFCVSLQMSLNVLGMTEPFENLKKAEDIAPPAGEHAWVYQKSANNFS